MENVKAIIAQYISRGDSIVIGVSGGPDSTALFHLLVEFSKKTQCNLIIAHVNHGIRGAEADRDEAFVKNLAAAQNLPFELKRVKLTGSALEERGRQIRREFFEHLRAKYKARWILTAHTEDDQLETIIFNFLRGSGVAGLAGMNVVDGFYFKPFLSVSKAEILQYLKKRKLRFCKDRTNRDTKLRRVFIRKKILPLLVSINPSFRSTLLRNSSIFRELEELVYLAAQKFLKRNGAGAAAGAGDGVAGAGSRIFSLKEYKSLPSALKSAVIQEAYRSGQKTPYGLPSVKVAEITRMLERGIGNKKIVCGGGGTFLLKKGDVYFFALGNPATI